MPLWKRNLFICWFGCFAAASGMSLVVPFLPLYIEQLGVRDPQQVVQWTGAAFGATFLMAAIMSPIWGRLGDRHGRRPMLLRASLGMAVVMSLIGLAHNVWQVVALRFLTGAFSGYIAASITLVATQAPRERSGWALATLSTGQISGTLLGPLLGGWLGETIGLRQTFFVTGGCMFAAFLVTWLFVHEAFAPSRKKELTGREVWRQIRDPRLVWALFLSTFMMQFANLSVEPIITVFIKRLLTGGAHVALISGMVVSAAGVGSILAAPRLGRLSDRIGPRKVLIGGLAAAAVVMVPQAFVATPWQLAALRFVMGLCLAGLVPAVNAMLRLSVPAEVTGRVFGYNQSARYLGNIAGPLLGGQVAAHFGLQSVFFSTAALLAFNAVWTFAQRRRTRADGAR